MTKDQFNELVTRVMAGEASEEEISRLRELSRSSAVHQKELAEAQALWNLIEEVGPLAESFDPPPAEIPAHICAKLTQAVLGEHCVGQEGGAPLPDQLRPQGVREHKKFRRSGAGLLSMLRIQLAGAFALVALVAVFSYRWIERRPPAAPDAHRIAAFLVLREPGGAVRREGKIMPVASTAALEARDEVRLFASAVATIIAETGEVEIAGPKRFLVRDVLTNLIPESRAGYQSVSSSVAALFKPLNREAESGLLVATRDFHPIPLYSPVGVTADLLPVIRWRSELGAKYDVTITDEFDGESILHLVGVTSPVRLSELRSLGGKALSKGGLYKILIVQSNLPITASENTFRTLERPSSQPVAAPAERLLRAWRLSRSDPSRTGDILEDLLELPPDWGNSSLALRLKLLCFGQLGYKPEFDSIADRLRERSAAP